MHKQKKEEGQKDGKNGDHLLQQVSNLVDVPDGKSTENELPF